jgi:hypothetical protein
MDDRRFRLDFVIALCALLISSVAAGASVYQTHVIARQFSATVWPYVTFETTLAPSSIEVDIRNDGLGPAIVRSVAITWDGKPQPSLEAILAVLAREPSARAASAAARASRVQLHVTTSTPERGLVVPANAAHTMLRLQGNMLVQTFGLGLKRLDVSLCYCSLTGTCWVQSLQDPTSEPRAAACS